MHFDSLFSKISIYLCRRISHITQNSKKRQMKTVVYTTASRFGITLLPSPDGRTEMRAAGEPPGTGDFCPPPLTF
jgi:hypothetical protein